MPDARHSQRGWTLADTVEYRRPLSAQHRPPAAPHRPPGAPPRPPAPAAQAKRRRPDASPWHWLLFVPIVLPLVTPLYNRMHPTLFGLPFYYWCQLAFAGFAAVVVAIVHTATKRR
jgi:hypothetical protein